MDVQSLMQDCLDVKINGAYKSKILAGIYHLFVLDCNLNHLKGGGEKNLFLPPCLTDKWDIIPGIYSVDRDISALLGQQKTV